MVGRAAIRLGIGPHSSSDLSLSDLVYSIFINASFYPIDVRKL